MVCELAHASLLGTTGKQVILVGKVRRAELGTRGLLPVRFFWFVSISFLNIHRLLPL